MFGLSVASEIFQGSTERTWNCVLHFVHLLWTKLNHIRQPIMPRSRKRHHSRSRSRSKSHSHDRSRERDDKHRKNDSHEKDRDGKRRKVESYDSPHHKRSVSSEPDCQHQENLSTVKEDTLEELNAQENEGTNTEVVKNSQASSDIPDIDKNHSKNHDANEDCSSQENSPESPIARADSFCEENKEIDDTTTDDRKKELAENMYEELMDTSETDRNEDSKNGTISSQDSVAILDDSDDKIDPNESDSNLKTINKLEVTPKKVQSPKQLKKRLDSEKKRQERQKEKEEKERKRLEEKERIKQEKQRKKEEKQREIEQKQKEKELKEEQRKKEKEEKEEQRRKEREEKEMRRKEREEKEEQKRKEKEQEKLKKQQEIEEKNKEKQKEQELKQKTAAAFVNFFVAKKSDNPQENKKAKPAQTSLFKAFEIKSDMRLPPARRKPLSEEEKEVLVQYFTNQDETASYITDLKSGKPVGKGFKTFPFEDTADDDIAIIEDGGALGETILEGVPKFQKLRAKFLKFHENRRPPYFGTWRKKSKFITGRKPFGEDKDILNYEEDSDDDWEEEEQGESINGSDDEADKENDDEKDDYEIDNEFFVPHGHLSDDEVDDEETARLSPTSLKQKLKLLKDEFEQDMQSKTHKLKPRSIGCIWYKRDGSNVEDAIHRYLQPLAVITRGQIQIKSRSEIFSSKIGSKKSKPPEELNPQYMPMFLKVIHGNCNKKRVLVDQFLTQMANDGLTVDIKKAALVRNITHLATWKKCKENGPLRNKCCWFVNDDVKTKYTVDLVLPDALDSDSKK